MTEPSSQSGEKLPLGTVTFVLSDVEGSTRAYEQFPDAMRLAMMQHDTLIDASVAANAGHVIRPRGEGDSRFLVFARATDAVAAARDIQQSFAAATWPTPSPMRVRIALHTGEADLHEGDYYGSEVNRCARIRALAYGGQVLLSQATYVLIRDALPPGVGVRDLGEHRLKDLQRPEHIFQLVLADAPSEFPSLKSLDALPNNLPPQLTSFVGRARELAEVKSLLARTPILTLTGPGGTGKTRLSLQLAAEVVEQFKDGAWFVDLSTLGDAAQVGQSIAQVLGVRAGGQQSLTEALQEYLRDKELLLVLDNFEQVIAAAMLVKDLVLHAPRVKFLVTSRIVLRIAGEQEYEVPQFALPDPKHLPPLEQLSQYDAVRLFIERARTYKSDWTITNENAPAVAELCYRLDALPLAIELAAARVRLLPPEKMLAQLEHGYSFLKTPARDLPARQQTLRGAIDWSYNLLTAPEQALFRQLAVFAGGATLDAIEAVCALDAGADVLAGLETLVDNSLIRQGSAAGEPRFSMLETIREYAAARLADDPQAAAIRRAHAAFFAELTRSQWEPLRGAARDSAQATLSADIENIHGAWQYWLAARDLAQLDKFADSLLLLNDLRGWYQASIKLTSDLLTVLAESAATPERARTELSLQMGLARALMIVKGYYSADAEQAHARALELSEREADSPELFASLRVLSRFYVYRGDFDRSARVGERLLRIGTLLADTDMQVEANLVLGTSLGGFSPLRAMGYFDSAIALYEAHARHAPRLSQGALPIVPALTTAGLLSWMLGFADRARKRADEALALAQTLAHPFSTCYAYYHAGLIRLWVREPAAARDLAESLVRMAEEHQFKVWSAVGACLHGAASADLGAAAEGLALLRSGITAYQGLNTPPIFYPFLLFLQAGAYGRAAQPADGLECLTLSIQLAGGEVPHNNAFLSLFLRLKGQLLLQTPGDQRAEAESYFQQSLAMADSLQASMLALRATISLSRLWQAQGKTPEARELLTSAYARITEGFDAADVQEAKAVLTELKGM